MSENKMEIDFGPTDHGYPPGAPLLERPGEPWRGTWVIARSGERVAEIPQFDSMRRNFDVSRAMVTGEVPIRKEASDLGAVSLAPNIENLTE